MKKQNTSPLLILAVALGGGVAGFALRLAMAGSTGWAYTCLWVLSLMALGALGIASLGMGRNSAMQENLTSRPVAGVGVLPTIGIALGGALLFAAFLIRLLQGGMDRFDTVASALGLLGGACLWIQAYLRRSGNASAAAGMVTAFALAANLVSSFRHWSADPLLHDYCFQLLACVFSMLAAYYLAGFPIGQGRRRATIFCSMSAVFFCLVSIADSGLISRLFYAGTAVWLLTGGCSLTAPAPRAPEANKEEA